MASVDTYWRFAEAVGRLDIREDSIPQPRRRDRWVLSRVLGG
jgi:hypothetical protein